MTLARSEGMKGPADPRFPLIIILLTLAFGAATKRV